MVAEKENEKKNRARISKKAGSGLKCAQNPLRGYKPNQQHEYWNTSDGQKN
jgi:hypothetical protein